MFSAINHYVSMKITKYEILIKIWMVRIFGEKTNLN